MPKGEDRRRERNRRPLRSAGDGTWESVREQTAETAENERREGTN